MALQEVCFYFYYTLWLLHKLSFHSFIIIFNHHFPCVSNPLFYSS
jgi:hypothetical protein